MPASRAHKGNGRRGMVIPLHPRTTVTIRRVVFDADFRTSEVSMWSTLGARFRRSVGAREVVLFVNKSGTLLRAVFRPDEDSQSVTFVQHRYTGRTCFSALTLQDVAHRHLNLHLLDGSGKPLKRLAEHFPHLFGEEDAS